MGRRFRILMVSVVMALSLLALYHLLSLQYETGEGYPVYSSYRADPLGTMALYDALDELDTVKASRNRVDLKHRGLPSDATLLIAGASLGEDTVSTLEELEAFVQHGGRLTILFQPYTDPNLTYFGVDDEDEDESESSDGESETGSDQDDGVDHEDMMSVLSPMEDISERWGMGYGKKERERNDAGVSSERALRLSGLVDLPDDLAWQSDLYFDDLADEWNVVYALDDHAVVIERSWGEGTIVLATDAYHVTNEAMLKSRLPGYLLWLIGDSNEVIFDESHLGIAPRKGLMQLMRHYKLVPLLLVCLLLSGLFLWKNTSSLIPIVDSDSMDDTNIEAFGTVEGLAHLARRSVSRKDLLQTCWDLFRYTPALSSRLDDISIKKIEQHIKKSRDSKRNQQDITNTFNEICSIVNERKNSRG